MPIPTFIWLCQQALLIKIMHHDIQSLRISYWTCTLIVLLQCVAKHTENHALASYSTLFLIISLAIGIIIIHTQSTQNPYIGNGDIFLMACLLGTTTSTQWPAICYGISIISLLYWIVLRWIKNLPKTQKVPFAPVIIGGYWIHYLL